jgi:hypothetical protein
MLHHLLHNQITIQVIGFVALGIAVSQYQVNKRKTILKLSVLSSLLWSLHFFLLGAITGSAMNISGAAQNCAFISIPERKRTWLFPTFFIIVFVIADILTWQGLISLLPLGGTVSGTFSFWQRNTKLLRFIALISPPLWFIYNFISHSYAGMFTEVGLLISTLIGIYRFDIKKQS